MTGNPNAHAFMARMNELGGEISGDEWFYAQVGGGLTMQAIAEQIGCSRQWLYTWLKGPGRKERFKEAQRDAAPLVFEDGGKILDDLKDVKGRDLSPAVVQVARARADFHIKRASVLDPETFGEKAGVQITVDIGQLHLDALRAKGSMTLYPKAETKTLGPGEPEPDEAA